VRDAREYSFQFLEWKRAYVLRKHWQAHRRSTCPRCGIKLRIAHLGRTHRRAFWCEHCQKLYGGRPGTDPALAPAKKAAAKKAPARKAAVAASKPAANASARKFLKKAASRGE
jgi:endonuclease-8